MLFPSVSFVFFFAIVLLLWWGPWRWTPLSRTTLLAVANTVFYACAGLRGLPVLLGVVLVTWLSGHALARSTSPLTRRCSLTLALCLLIGHLLVWKDAGWAAFGWNDWATQWGWPEVPFPDWAYPAGISFFTFHAVAHLLRQPPGPPARLFTVWAKVGFFPTLIAGPVLYNRTWDARWLRAWRFREVAWGEAVSRFMLGMTFKWVLASWAQSQADPLFEGARAGGLYTVWAVHAYALQIFFDFAGYSHLALGVALLLGWRLPENFTQPYLATSLTDFWRRWHRSLSFFFRDFVYIGTFGGRRARGGATVALLGTMLLSGLWHGASVTFVVWGLWHGIGVVVHKAAERSWRFSPAVSRFITLEAVVWGWVWFRAPDMPTAKLVFSSLLQPSPPGVAPAASAWAFMAISVLFIVAERRLLSLARFLSPRLDASEVCAWTAWGRTATFSFFLTLWAAALIHWGPAGVPAFIYAGF